MRYATRKLISQWFQKRNLVQIYRRPLKNSVLYYSDINKIKAKEKHSKSEQMKQLLAHCVSAHHSWSSLNQHYETYIHASVSTFDYHDTTITEQWISGKVAIELEPMSSQ